VQVGFEGDLACSQDKKFRSNAGKGSECIAIWEALAAPTRVVDPCGIILPARKATCL